MKIWPFFQRLTRLFWTPVKTGMCIRMPRFKNWKKKEFALSSENIKETIGIQFIFMLKIKLQKYIFWENMTFFLAANISFLNTC